MILLDIKIILLTFIGLLDIKIENIDTLMIEIIFTSYITIFFNFYFIFIF